MESTTSAPAQVKKNVYSVWALPPEGLTPRLKELMEGLRSEFGGPCSEPHVTVVGAMQAHSTEEANWARDKFNQALD
ncbi:UNVERIFIED_CONTAM: Cyclic phosphodiesterase [Sesamum latifolium]|uniref:Cyclic phosphodiesterase n=1 Tax=Sesamum latifolium TaxID=2727402 RepID=A0AAW2WPA1_9LAMI